ncbi:hypothetical protein, conserved [Trypanosoma brucei brucei TREU927]|uniref:Uncharacterized protein n=1 Tax=Trypanosoma brucei brucei (strain 927/4 GUTat10.1) TaxID=185431 RepID=Q38EG9_TRYB2|nr:hypothetical protein, conserved [Trypanosoma brucei brucei TREU927]EAN76801.1 hypothetical protein, conserved [Trypanosoma brucei brucei TREU927]
MKGRGKAMFLWAGMTLLLFSGRGEGKAEGCTLRRYEVDGREEDIHAVIVNADEFANGNYKWMLCNNSGRREGGSELLWFCGTSSNNNPTSLITSKFNWSGEVGDVTVCKAKVDSSVRLLKEQVAQLQQQIEEAKEEHARLQEGSTREVQEKKKCQKEMKTMSQEDGKIRDLTNESARLDTLSEKEATECKKKKLQKQVEYDLELERMDKEIESVKKAIELKEQQLEKLGNNNCPACDAGTCWDDVHIKENLDKLYGKDGWTKSGVKCGAPHEDTEGNNSKYNENM